MIMINEILVNKQNKNKTVEVLLKDGIFKNKQNIFYIYIYFLIWRLKTQINPPNLI